MVEELHHELLVKELWRRTIFVELADMLQFGKTGDGWWLDQKALEVLCRGQIFSCLHCNIMERVAIDELF